MQDPKVTDFVFFVKNYRQVTPKWPQWAPTGAPVNPQSRQMKPNNAPEATQWTPKGDKWSPNGRPKAPKAAQGSPKTTEDRPKEPNAT